MSGLNKEIWIDKLKDNFYSGYEWIQGVEDWGQYVEFNTINLTQVGADPVIIKNNSSYPIVAVQRTDTNLTVTLDYYDSTTTRIYWNREQVEAAIDKLESVVKQHRSALMQEIQKEALWNYAPASNTANSPVFAATGTNRTAVIGSQSTVAATLTLGDIATAALRLDLANFPKQGRVLVLNPYHGEDLMKQDIGLFKSFLDLKAGTSLSMFGFEVFQSVDTPLYTKSTLAKKAYGAVADNTNDCIASTFFIKSEVMKAMGDMDMFFKGKDINTDQRADEVGFQVRFKAVPQVASRCIGAIVSNRA